MELGLAPLCFECRHFAGVVPGVGWSCTAFRRIPVPILVKSHDHRQPYPGDGGLRFEPVPPVSEAQRRAMFAAASGHSTLGIPRKVGEEFVGKADDDAEDGGKDFLRSAKAFLRGLISWVSEEEAEGEHAADAEPPKGHAASVAFVTQDGEVLFVRR